MTTIDLSGMVGPLKDELRQACQLAALTPDALADVFDPDKLRTQVEHGNAGWPQALRAPPASEGS